MEKLHEPEQDFWVQVRWAQCSLWKRRLWLHTIKLYLAWSASSVHFRSPPLLPGHLRNCCTLCIFWMKLLDNMFSLHKSGEPYFVLFSRLWTFTVISLSAQTSFNPKGNCKCCSNNPASVPAAVVREGPGFRELLKSKKQLSLASQVEEHRCSVCFAKICSILFFAQWFNSKFLHYEFNFPLFLALLVSSAVLTWINYLLSCFIMSFLYRAFFLLVFKIIFW